MMKLEFTLFADAADIGRSGKLALVGANIEHITADSMPATILNLALIAFFAVPESDIGVEHILGLSVEDPSGDSLLTASHIASMTPQANTLGLPVRYVTIVNLGGLVVRAFGKHTVRLIVDGEEAGVATFVVGLPSPASSANAAAV